MINQIVVLLATTCLVLLNQTSGELVESGEHEHVADPRRFCSSYWFHCKSGKSEIYYTAYASICVPFKLTFRGCKPKLTTNQIIEKCVQLRPKREDKPNHRIMATRGALKCKLLESEGPNPNTVYYDE